MGNSITQSKEGEERSITKIRYQESTNELWTKFWSGATLTYVAVHRSVDEYVVHGGAALDVAECFVCRNGAACGDAPPRRAQHNAHRRSRAAQHRLPLYVYVQLLLEKQSSLCCCANFSLST